MPYGPSVRSSWLSLTMGAELHMVPSATRAQIVNAVEPNKIAAPTTRSHAAFTVIKCTWGAVLRMIHSMMATTSTTDPNGVRARLAGPRNAVYNAPTIQVSANAPQHAPMAT